MNKVAKEAHTYQNVFESPVNKDKHYKERMYCLESQFFLFCVSDGAWFIEMRPGIHLSLFSVSMVGAVGGGWGGGGGSSNKLPPCAFKGLCFPWPKTLVKALYF